MARLKRNQSLHRIIEWPGLKRTSKVIWFQPPCYVQGRQPPDQAAQSHILAMNASRDGASTTSLGNLFLCVTILCVKNFLLTTTQTNNDNETMLFYAGKFLFLSTQCPLEVDIDLKFHLTIFFPHLSIHKLQIFFI